MSTIILVYGRMIHWTKFGYSENIQVDSRQSAHVEKNAMRDERLLLTAIFDRKLIIYWMIGACLTFVNIIIGIPLVSV